VSRRSSARQASRPAAARPTPDAPPLRTRRLFVAWPLRVSAVLLTLLGVVPLANIVTTGEGLPWYSSAVQQWLVWGGALAALTIAASYAAPAIATRLADRLAALLLRPSKWAFVALLAMGTFALSVMFGWHIVTLQPTAGDEFSQLFEARLLSLGHLYARSETLSEFFNTSETLDIGGRWFAQFPIGGPAFLAIGLLARIPSMLNPILVATSICAVYRFVARAFDEATARVSALCCALSPFILFLSGTQMNHVPTLAMIWIAVAALPRWQQGKDEGVRVRSAIVIGVTIGAAATVRPYDAALAALCIGAVQLHAAVRNPSLRRSLLAQAVAGAVPVLALLAANHATTGGAFSFAYDVLNGAEHRPGFHMTPLGFEHTPRRGLYVISAYLLKLDVMLLGWPAPAVLLVVTTLALQRSTSRWDLLLLALLWTTLFGYFVYWGESYFLGPRFLYVIAPVLVIYVARMSEALRERVTRPAARAAARLVPVVWLATAWVIPNRAERNFGVATLVSTAIAQRSAAALIANALAGAKNDSALVFIQESWHGRLVARLRTLELRPLEAEQTVKSYDACTIQSALDSTARIAGMSRHSRTEAVWLAIYRDPPALPLSGMTALDQVALVPNRPLTAQCKREMGNAMASGITLAEMLPYETFDSSGRLSGPVVYARDFGGENERLRARFPGRRWLVALTTSTPAGLQVEFAPYGAVPAAVAR
jgi:4-amino-4-deoxy-L-arabinose transferase-like glycosyltransferase